jgi:hypothetical protein
VLEFLREERKGGGGGMRGAECGMVCSGLGNSGEARRTGRK